MSQAPRMKLKIEMKEVLKFGFSISLVPL